MMQESLISLLIDLAKVGGGVFALLFIQWLTAYLNKGKGKKVAGNSVCPEHAGLAKTTTENNTILKAIQRENQEARRDAKDERGKLFDKVDELEKDMGIVKKNIAVLQVKQDYFEDHDPPDSSFQAKEIKDIEILVVDDNESVAKATSVWLEDIFHYACKCTPCFSTHEAMRMLKEHEYDLIFIDLYHKSGPNGYELDDYCTEAYPKMKRIIYSGTHPDKIRADIADRWLEKPFNKDVVIEKVNKILEI